METMKAKSYKANMDTMKVKFYKADTLPINNMV